MGQVYWGGVAAVGVMYAVFLAVGWLAARKVKEGTATDLILAGRALPLWLAVMTMTATWVDGGYLNGTVEGVYRGNLATAFQPGFCFGLSLILGGLFFAGKMRRLEFTTLIDPFEDRFGKRWGAVLFVPAMFGEVVWCGALLIAIGTTFSIILDLDKTSGILLSAAVVTAYTMIGGMWSVAYTDAFQLLLVPTGLLAALPFALAASGGLAPCWERFAALHPGGTRLLPPLTASPHWSPQALVSWWDLSLMLVLGGIPWNCYFQRVLSCKTPRRARQHSLLAGALTMSMTVPPLLLGLAAVAYYGKTGVADATFTLPRLLADVVPPGIRLIGLAAIVGAVTSSFSSSILSSASMTSWNVYRTLLAPRTSLRAMKFVIRACVLLFGAAAIVLALSVGSVLELWTFTADLVYVLLFPQLVMALFDPKTNRLGSMAAFTVSLLLRLGGGEPLFGVPALIPYPRLLPEWLVGNPEIWYQSGMRFPFRTLAALVGLILLPLVSRLTARWDPPRGLRAAPDVEATKAGVP